MATAGVGGRATAGVGGRATGGHDDIEAPPGVQCSPELRPEITIDMRVQNFYIRRKYSVHPAGWPFPAKGRKFKGLSVNRPIRDRGGRVLLIPTRLPPEIFFEAGRSRVRLLEGFMLWLPGT